MFKKCIDVEKIECKKVVCLDVKTRWNSTYLMIDSALPFKKAFDRLEEQDYNYYMNMCRISGTKDWAKLRSLHSFLKEFYLLTKRMFGSNYPTSHTYFDEVSSVKVLLVCEMARLAKTLYVVLWKKKMHENFGFYCKIEKLNPFFLASVVLDPLNKIEYLELWYYKLLDSDLSLTDESRKKKVDSFIEDVQSFMSRLYETYKNEIAKCDEVGSTSLINDSARKESVPENDIKDEIRAKLKRKSTMDALSDLESYLHDGIEGGGSNFDVLG